MKVAKLSADLREREEVGGERNSGKFFGQIVLVFLPVPLVVEDAVDIVENAVFGDGAIAIVSLELLERSTQDIVNIDTAVGGDCAF